MIKINKKYTSLIPGMIAWFIENYCLPEPEFSDIRIILNKVLDEYNKNFKAYSIGEKDFELDDKYLYSVKEAVHHAYTDEYSDNRLLIGELRDYLEEIYLKR